MDVGISPRCCKASPAPSQAAGGFQSSLLLAGGGAERGANAPGSHSRVVVAQHELGSLMGQAGCREGLQGLSTLLIHECLRLSYNSFRPAFLQSNHPHSRWQCDPGTSVSQFWHVWVMLPPYSNIMWQAQHMFWKGLQFILAAPNLLDLFNPAFTLHHLNHWGCF